MKPAENKFPWRLTLTVAVIGLLNGLACMPSLVAYRDGALPAIGTGMICSMPFLVGILGAFIFTERKIINSIYLVLLYLLAAAPLLGEATICIIIFAPIALIMATLSCAITDWLLQRLFRKPSLGNQAALLTMLALPATMAAMDLHFLPKALPEEVVSDSVLVPLSGRQVWQKIERTNFDFAKAEVPSDIRWLMPVPESITGLGTDVGDKRIVEFHNGTVVAQVVKSNFPAYFEFTLDLNRKGNEFFDHWVKFKSSSFRFQPVGTKSTLVTHVTVYHPRVFPRWYFQLIEKFFAHRLQKHMIQAFFAHPTQLDVEVPPLADR